MQKEICNKFHLAVGKDCVQQFADKYLTGNILGTLNNGILKLTDALKILFQMRRHTALQLLWLSESIMFMILFLENRWGFNCKFVIFPLFYFFRSQ